VHGQSTEPRGACEDESRPRAAYGIEFSRFPALVCLHDRARTTLIGENVMDLLAKSD